MHQVQLVYRSLASADDGDKLPRLFHGSLRRKERRKEWRKEGGKEGGKEERKEGGTKASEEERSAKEHSLETSYLPDKYLSFVARIFFHQ